MQTTLRKEDGVFNTMKKDNSNVIRHATVADVAWVAQHLRQSDIDEQRALGNMAPPWAFLRRSAELSSVVYAGVDPVDGHPCCIFGLGEFLAGYKDDGGWHNYWPIWLLATPNLERNRRLFVEYSEQFFRSGSSAENWGGMVLGNVVWESNKASIRWLMYFGFEDKGTVFIPETGEKFIRLVRRPGGRK